jgi:hypothetical protein
MPFRDFSKASEQYTSSAVDILPGCLGLRAAFSSIQQNQNTHRHPTTTNSSSCRAANSSSSSGGGSYQPASPSCKHQVAGYSNQA